MYKILDCPRSYLSDIHKQLKKKYFLNILKSFIYSFALDLIHLKLALDRNYGVMTISHT